LDPVNTGGTGIDAYADAGRCHAAKYYKFDRSGRLRFAPLGNVTIGRSFRGTLRICVAASSVTTLMFHVKTLFRNELRKSKKIPVFAGIAK
jgi:hypothetical protein